MWEYMLNPVEGDARKFVTLLDADNMVWVGIRYWHFQERRWYNGNDPEKATVIAWANLPQPAKGRWYRGQLIEAEPPQAKEMKE